MRFDWIVGNPPWMRADREQEPLAHRWISAQREQYPADNNSVAGAFSWRVLGLLASDGYAGLLLPAALLYNQRAERYRQAFFAQCEVRRITNFANLRRELFEGRATAAAITMIYHQIAAEQEQAPIEHYGPFARNQMTRSHGKMWGITLNEQEYQSISPDEAARGEGITWKFALWGSHRDIRAIARLRKLFPLTLGQLQAQKSHWYLSEGPQLRHEAASATETLERRSELVGRHRLDTVVLNASRRLFSIPDEALKDIQPEAWYICRRGGREGFMVSEPPHLIISNAWNSVIFSDQFFVVKPRQMAYPSHRPMQIIYEPYRSF